MNKKYLQKVQLQLMLRKRWAYLRYLHQREAFLQAEEVKSFLSVGCGLGLAELALSLEFPQVHFHLTDFDSKRFEMVQNLVNDWSIKNITLGHYNALHPSKENYDFVSSIEVLEHIENDAEAVENMCKTANKYVFSLIPFATEQMNKDPQKRKYAWEKHEHYRCGYDESNILALFKNNVSSIVKIQGCYWKEYGFQLRQELENISKDKIKENLSELVEQAQLDIHEGIPQGINEALGIWTLVMV